MTEKPRGTLGDPEVVESIREMERATGNKVRVLMAPDGGIVLDFSTPGNEDVKAISNRPISRTSRKLRRAKRRRKT